MMVWLFLAQWSWLQVDAPGDVGYYAALALDSQDWPHIAYCDFTTYGVKYARWAGSGWQTQRVDTIGSASGGYVSVDLDSQDRPCISYSYWIDGVNSDLKYAYWNGSSWQRQTVDTVGNTLWTSLALNSLDRPCIAYSDNGYSIIQYAYWNGSAWVLQQVDILGICTSLALDSQDRPHIAYYSFGASARDLKYAYWNGSSWQTQKVDTAGSVGLWTSIAIDSQDRPHISYYDSSAAKRDLKYAYWNGSSWQIQTVDTAGDVGRYTSLALDSQDRPHIAYYDVTNQRLKYAVWNGSSWTIEVADPNTWAGYWMTDRSLQVGSDDCPRIAYYRSGDLYYAHRGCPPLEIGESSGPKENSIVMLSTVSVEIRLTKAGQLTAYDPIGRELRTWSLEPGRHSISLDGIGKGVCFLALSSHGNIVDTRTIVLNPGE
ncbi:MAG: hypothetical protein ABIM74_00870 [candidate division WOR-3 bacterium]